jgi:hypothetical protein
MRSKLIKEALDRMNAHYRGRKKPTYTQIPIEEKPFVSEGDYHFERRKESTYYHDRREKRSINLSRFKRALHFDWRTKKLLTSLKLWFVAFWITVGVLYLAEGNDPTSFYNSIPDPLKYVFYIFAVGISGWIGYRIFEKLDTNPTSDRGVFGLKNLSGLFLMF